MITEETPWELLRSALIWCPKTQREFTRESFFLGSIIFRSWQLTIQMAMAAWSSINCIKNLTRKANLKAAFLGCWFASDILGRTESDVVHWNTFPVASLLPRRLAYLYQFFLSLWCFFTCILFWFCCSTCFLAYYLRIVLPRI